MTDEEIEAVEGRLTRLWLEAREMATRWQPKVAWYVEGTVGLHPWNSDEKVRDDEGRLINLRRRDGDDDFDADYSAFEEEYFAWNERVQLWLSELPPRFQHCFDGVIKETVGFSRQFDGQYAYLGEVPELLKLYDDFYKKYAAIDKIRHKIGSDGWSIKEDDDIAFELRYDEVAGNLLLNGSLIHHFNYDSDFENALAEALCDDNKTHRVEMDASDLQSNVGMLKIPRDLRKLMIKASQKSLKVNPQITFGDLKRAGLDDAEITEKLRRNIAKT